MTLTCDRCQQLTEAQDLVEVGIAWIYCRSCAIERDTTERRIAADPDQSIIGEDIDD